jgi:hypothetical protein
VFARELVARGVAKVYGTARKANSDTEPGVSPLALDITDTRQVASVAERCRDVNLLVMTPG